MKKVVPTLDTKSGISGDATSNPLVAGSLDRTEGVAVHISEPPVPIRRQSLGHALMDAWQQRGLFWSLVAQVVSLRMPRTVLGIWWFPIIILFNTVGATLIFGEVLNVGTGSGVPYFLFAAAGSTAWFLFYRGAILSMRSFHRFRHFVVGLSIPVLIVPFAGVAMATVFVAFSLILLFGAFPVFWALDGELYLNLGPELVLVPVALLWVGLLAAVIGLWSGAVYWRARDVRQMFRIVLPFIMYVTPILYPLSTLEATVGGIANLNPLASPVELLRAGVFGTEAPPAYALATALGLTAALLLAGCWFTNRFAYTFLGWQDDDVDDDEM